MGAMMRRLVLVLLLLLVLAGAAVAASAHWLSELWWFQEVGAESVFWVNVLWPWAVRLVFGFALSGFFYLNLRAAGESLRRLAFQLHQRLPRVPWTWVRTGLAGASLVLGFLSSSTVALYWEVIARFLYRVPFGRSDPLFGRDLGFYVFELPFYRLLYHTAMAAAVLALLLVAILYVLTRAIEPDARGLYVEPRARRHLLFLGAGILLLKAADYRLQQLELVHSRRGVVYGAGYTDANVVLPALTLMIVLSLLAAVLVAAGSRRSSLRRPGIALAGLLLASVLFLGVVPGLVQRFIVEPNELELERPYIARTIAMTRFGYGVDRIDVRDFEVRDDLSWEGLLRNRGTLENIRLWDWRPMLTSFRQLQEIRFYYSFPEIDVARYWVNGAYRQVMTAARELDVTQIPNRTWINEHLQYTHGYGFIMSPVNESTAEGLPRFFIQNIPPETAFESLQVERPEIYFGELTNHYVLVRTRIPEFDYPLGDTSAWTRYEGTGGIPIGNLFRRAVFAVRMRAGALLLSRDITPETRILMRRNIHERVRAVAPFLRFDQDPYLVLVDGRLFWIQDAYTTASGLPYSDPVPGWGNYVRNSVKVVIDAYNGDTTFYAFDEEDPVLQVYRRLYPRLFTPAGEMPEGLRAHVRYPEDLFLLQARVYAVYHMTDPTIFYNQEDVWHIPREIYQGREQEMSPYYTILQLPGADAPEMVLMLPFTPARRNNMVAWLAARNDGEHYGHLIAYRFPRDQLVFGPMQIEARIDQDPAISEVLTLWNQGGSQVIRGNLLVLPVENGLLYVKPIFLRADTGELPELVRVIVAFGPRLAMMPTLEMALAAVFGREIPAPLTRETRPDVAVSPADPLTPGVDREVGRLARQALDQWRKAQEAVRAGDWAAYGEALQVLESLLEELARRTGTGGPD